MTGYVPKIWKSAKIVPLFKSGEREAMGNYRPISLLPTLSKVLEKAVYHQLSNYLDLNKILYRDQFGFRQKYTTEDALLRLIHLVSEAKQLKKQNCPIALTCGRHSTQ